MAVVSRIFPRGRSAIIPSHPPCCHKDDYISNSSFCAHRDLLPSSATSGRRHQLHHHPMWAVQREGYRIESKPKNYQASPPQATLYPTTPPQRSSGKAVERGASCLNGRGRMKKGLGILGPTITVKSRRSGGGSWHMRGEIRCCGQ